MTAVITKDMGIPSILHVCQASRTIALKMYSVWPCDIIYKYGSENSTQSQKPRYLNTLYDTFYIVGPPDPRRNRILQAMSRPITYFPKTSKQFASIRHIHVDFGIYIVVSASLWAQAFRLEKLTIVLHASSSDLYDFEDETDPYDVQQYGFNLGQLGEFDRKSTYSRRMEWVLRRVRKKIENAKAQYPDLHFPEVDITTRVSGCAHDANPPVDEVVDDAKTEDETYDEWTTAAVAHWGRWRRELSLNH